MGTAALLLPGTLQVWVDESGHTYLTNAAEPPTRSAVRWSPDQVMAVWKGDFVGKPVRARTTGNRTEDRYLRELGSAADDLRRGETRRGLERLKHLHRANPARPEAAWLIAQVERRRGRLLSARAALQEILQMVTPSGDEWHSAAERSLDEIRSELELERVDPAAPVSVETLDTAHFRVRYDHAFAGRDYGQRVERILEDARVLVGQTLGRELEKPLDVHLYTKGHYLESYKHKFGFATVGFYDGAIHVVSARHPREELRALLVHEYAHAVFRDALGSDRPFFLNEGIADREEERARSRPKLAREEWRRLLDAMRTTANDGSSEQGWIPLESLVSGFSGLRGRRALLAYLESRAAVQLIEERHPRAIQRWLARCARGEGWERALRRETGWNLPRLEAALRADVAGRFPTNPLP